MRPRTAGEMGGQAHLLAPGGALADIAAGVAPPHSMILWGPPGCGKTTLARALAEAVDARWFALSAAAAGLREVREVIDEAKTLRAAADPRRRVLFLDEIHRFNKSQQDVLLPHVEDGLLILIGATTENPSFELNSALLSRLAVHILHPLSADELKIIARRAAQTMQWTMDDDAENALTTLADGDARRLLNMMERAAAGGAMNLQSVKKAAGESRRRFDKGGDNFYDQLSALHKSVRGSDPDAALYWLCRMLDGGADPRNIGRRLIRAASEDVGLADPRALALALDADAAYRRLGSPEGELMLAQAAVYLACVPKSDSVYRAFGKMSALVKKDGSRPVPAHLCNAPTKLMRDIGRGEGYRHAHDEEGGYAAGENYFPDGMRALRFYAPTDRGLEEKIKVRLQALRARDKAAK